MWRAEFLAIEVHRSDKDFSVISKIQNEISAETIRVRKAVDEANFRQAKNTRQSEVRSKVHAEVQRLLKASGLPVTLPPFEPSYSTRSAQDETTALPVSSKSPTD
jgi:hypothetical protein